MIKTKKLHKQNALAATTEVSIFREGAVRAETKL